ncbi:hypothetical protein CRYUN_Cryun08bG0140700 [Craigia yunnanensis]
MSLLLLIIYNCSDQVISTQERRQAKSREAAARHARETAKARERWKTAKDVAKKGGWQQQLSQTLSRAKSNWRPEQQKISGLGQLVKVDTQLPPAPPRLSEQSATDSKAKKKQPSSLTKMLHSLEEDPKSHEGKISMATDNDIRTRPVIEISFKDLTLTLKGKHIHLLGCVTGKLLPGRVSAVMGPSGAGKTTFLSALTGKTAAGCNVTGSILVNGKNEPIQSYKKIIGFVPQDDIVHSPEEDPKSHQGIISMATDNDIRTRPVIEISFKDLTLTLKGKHTHLLRCVTGKLMPGRVTTVMGPSGAGKTTFLSALTGKTAAGWNVKGSILVNGKNEPIQSYKKIIGFVPQDDIVHGNLIVEENLRFSARCRLSADLAKAEKVLVIERVIESLGLQAVRDSPVGTVEKQGISGGQRKRSNVGLEMVMEPSLLILDEPTTGLDSSSSQLLLGALRREALEGVNICMVLHQPSYTLFKMFDDLKLLAKGGLIAYHGSVKKVGEYFAGMGINVPERVNPPDHYIDILEGILKPTGVTHEQLPIRWMLHNGYPIPLDMLHLVDGLTTPSAGSNPSTSGAAAVGQSFAGDLWHVYPCSISSTILDQPFKITTLSCCA